MSARPAPRIGFSLEYFMWIFIRISGLFMILFGFIGIVGAFWMEARLYFQTGDFVDIGTLARWTFFPISTHVSSSDPGCRAAGLGRCLVADHAIPDRCSSESPMASTACAR